MSETESYENESIITQEMFGLFIAFGADMILLYGALAVFDVVHWVVPFGVILLVFGFFGGWIVRRWRRLRDKPEQRDPHETLKARYAAGELSDEAFEEKLDTLLDSDRQVDKEGTADKQELSSSEEQH
ncbi:SHOCT domain-containing protein [Halovenus rubra]|uniref:SHOCT domain-containing protein n=2 Tax=Halovenus rubra TaxID=869890 RepID=A0ACC7DWM8_9EURY|nr:SHOCT domain-containing protein [Halovenus rubra]